MVLYLGDSLTCGTVGQSYLKFMAPHSHKNKGLNGDTTYGSLRRLKTYRRRPWYKDVDTCVVEIGTNDILQPYMFRDSLIWSICYKSRSSRKRWAETAEGNTAGGYGLTVVVLAIAAVLTLIPDLLAALTLTWGADLAEALGDTTFTREAVLLCQRTADRCRTVAVATMLIAVVTNLLQLLLLGVLRSAFYSVTVPVIPLVLSVALYLLCRCLRRGKELQDDSDSII